MVDQNSEASLQITTSLLASDLQNCLCNVIEISELNETRK